MQDCEAATCCLTDLPVGRVLAQYGQWVGITGRFSQLHDEEEISVTFLISCHLVTSASWVFCLFVCFHHLLPLLWPMPQLLGQMPHSFHSTILTQIANALFTCLCLFNVCGVGVYKYMSFSTFPQASIF